MDHPTASGNFRITSRSTGSFWALTAGRDGASSVNNYMYTGATDQQWVFVKYTLSLSASKNWVAAGQTLQINPSNKALSITWSSSSTSVATVSSSGKVTGRTPGTAIITAKAGGVTATYTVTVRNSDPFHPDNIEYMRIKKYDRSSSGGDSDITTIVVKSVLDTSEYFEVYAPERADVSFKIDQSLITELNSQESSYQRYPTIGVLANFYYHLAKLGVDEMVEEGIIETGSAEYYGIWASEANRLLIGANKAASVVQLTCAVVSAVYCTYNVVSAIKTAQMSVNTTQTYSAASYRAVANAADDLVENMTNNPNANTVMLGTEADGKSWYQIAQQQGRSYFYSEDYDTYILQYGKDAMLEANKDFIFKAKNAGKTFWFSHDPLFQLEQYPDSTYALELRYLQRLYGISESAFGDHIFTSGNYYYFVP